MGEGVPWILIFPFSTYLYRELVRSIKLRDSFRWDFSLLTLSI